MADLRRDYLGYNAFMHRTYGDIVHVKVLHEHVYTVYSPELIRALLVDHAHHLVRHERAIDVLTEIHGHSVMASEGDTWQRQARLLRPGFAPKRVHGYARLMVDAATQALDQLHVFESGDASVIDIGQLMSRVTMDVILRTLFSQPADHERDDAIAAINVLDQVVMKELFWPVTLPDWLPLPGKARKRQALKQLNALIGGHIQARQAMKAHDAPQDDLLAMLLAARDGDFPASGAHGLSPQEIHDQCKVMFLAGYETTAIALTWWSWLMASHPKVAERAHAEIATVLGDRDPSPEDLAQLPWLQASLKEALRLYPPAASLLMRRTLADIQLGSWTIPAGALVSVVQREAHLDARWFEDPLAFRPERFMPDAPPMPRGAWMPFGAGPRVCMGQHFAMLEMALVSAMLLQRYRLQPLPGQQEPVADMQITLRPAHPLRLNLSRLRCASASRRT